MYHVKVIHKLGGDSLSNNQGRRDDCTPAERHLYPYDNVHYSKSLVNGTEIAQYYKSEDSDVITSPEINRNLRDDYLYETVRVYQKEKDKSTSKILYAVCCTVYIIDSANNKTVDAVHCSLKPVRIQDKARANKAQQEKQPLPIRLSTLSDEQREHLIRSGAEY